MITEHFDQGIHWSCDSINKRLKSLEALFDQEQARSKRLADAIARATAVMPGGHTRDMLQAALAPDAYDIGDIMAKKVAIAEKHDLDSRVDKALSPDGATEGAK